MSELRQRSHLEGEEKKKHEDSSMFDKAPDRGEKSDEDEDEELSREMGVSAPTELSQGTDKTTEALDVALKDLTPRWRNWVIRGIFTWLMIFGFAFIIYLGPLALVTLILGLQIKCFHEIITIGYVVYRSYHLPWFRTLSWYFLFASNYFFYGESFIDHFGVLLHRTDILVPFVTYHRLISFALYCSGIVGFVFSLKKKYYLKQFTMFGWTHVTLLLVVTQSHLIMQNIFEGLIWFLVPVCMIICNDIMAYMFGFFFGKTPLIKLSPKKTWEGFIGGALSTIVFGIVFSYWLASYDSLVCPISYDEVKNLLTRECEKNPVFILTEYQLPLTLQGLFAFMRIPWRTIHLYPFMLHSILMSIFASVIGPFGGFFASGFKRAFKIKDFGDTIPGHGGIMDRFDCQFLMATFVHVYHFSFIRVPNSQRILQSILLLPAEEQLQVFNMLKDKLLSRQLLNMTNTS